MAVLFIDGFSHYATADITEKWTVKTDAGVTWSIVNEGRNGGCIKRTSNDGTYLPGYINKAPTVSQSGVWTPQDTGICGFALKVDDLARVVSNPGEGPSQDMLNCLFAVKNGNWGMLGIGLNSDGTLTLFRPLAGTILAVSIGALQNNVWCYLEFKWTISKTAGSFIIRANDKVVMNYSGILYPATSVYPWVPTEHWTSVNVLACQSVNGAPYLIMRMCDFYLADDTGTFNNNFLGNSYFKYIRPNAPGTTTAWTPTGLLNWQNVDEIPQNDDVDYNSATAINTLDLFEFEDVGTIIPVAIQHVMASRRTEPGNATIQSVSRPVTTNYSSLSQTVVGETYAFNTFPYDTNPETSAQWTAGQIDNSEFGTNKLT